MKRMFLLFALVGLFCSKPVSSETSQLSWTILESYTITGKASGLAWDGTYIYFGIYGADGGRVFRFDPADGTHELLFNNPSIGDSYGMTWDGQSLWIIDRLTTGPSFALQLDLNGNVLSQFTLPNQYMSGIAHADGDFWVCTYHPNPGLVHKVNNTGTVLHEFVPPYDQPWDVCLQGDDLWIVDYFAHKINKVDTLGVVLEEHDAQTQRPAGIVFDGTYIWYVDGPLGSNSTLYKVDPGGAGTPAITVPVTSHHYGNVTVGSSATWNMTVNSTGTAPLIVDEIIFPHNFPVYTTADLPITIPAGESAVIPLVFEPTAQGELNGVVQVSSNDPVAPLVNVTLTGFAVIDGPYILLPETSHNYGTIRTTATQKWSMEVQNTGNAMLSISSIETDSPNFYVDDLLDFPVHLNPLETATFNVWFWPSQGINYSAVLNIFSNDPLQNPYLVSLSGAGQDGEYPMGTQLWDYLINTSWDNSPKAIHYIPDINTDGVADVIVCSEDNYVRAFNGNASGTGDVIWELHIPSGALYNQQALTLIEDIDGDGYMDVVVGTAWGDRSIVAASGKTGEQIWKHQTNNYGQGGWVYQVFAEFDFNGDGFPDVLACAGDDTNGQGPRRVYCLNGTTGTPIWETFLGGAGYRVIGVQDFTGDGIPDVVAAGTVSSQGKIWGMNGANGTIMWTFNTSGTAGYALTQIDDITGDGIPDIVAGSFNGYYYLMNPVNGTVLHQGFLGNNIVLDFAVLDDINGDGYVDFVPGHSGSFIQAISGFNGQAIWTQSLPDKPWNISRMPDISGDGINDVVFGTLFQNNFVYFFDGVDGSTLFSASYPTPVDAIGVIPDVTGDSSWEVVVGGRNGLVTCFSGGILEVVTLPGDANCDGEVNVMDVITIVSYIMGENPDPFCAENADVTGDGIIDVMDVIGVVNIILGGQSQAIKRPQVHNSEIILPEMDDPLLQTGSAPSGLHESAPVDQETIISIGLKSQRSN
jgi:hypothetical protein